MPSKPVKSKGQICSNSLMSSLRYFFVYSMLFHLIRLDSRPMDTTTLPEGRTTFGAFFTYICLKNIREDLIIGGQARKIESELELIKFVKEEK